MRTQTVMVNGSMDKSRLDNFLQALLWEKNVTDLQGRTIEVIRLKVWSGLIMIGNLVKL